MQKKIKFSFLMAAITMATVLASSYARADELRFKDFPHCEKYWKSWGQMRHGGWKTCLCSRPLAETKNLGTLEGRLAMGIGRTWQEGSHDRHPNSPTEFPEKGNCWEFACLEDYYYNSTEKRCMKCAAGTKVNDKGDGCTHTQEERKLCATERPDTCTNQECVRYNGICMPYCVVKEASQGAGTDNTYTEINFQ